MRKDTGRASTDRLVSVLSLAWIRVGFDRQAFACSFAPPGAEQLLSRFLFVLY
eukprot:SAG22_NODE_1258_length_4983_cov_2.401925_7_plen_53_part_00